MPDLKEISTKEGLNLFAAETETKLKALEDTYAKKFEELEAKTAADEEEAKKKFEENTATHEKENAELKTTLELTQTQLAEIKEVQKLQYTKVSGDEKMSEIGQFLLAMQKGDFKSIYEMGGKVNAVIAGDDWKGKDWDMKAAPNLGMNSALQNSNILANSPLKRGTLSPKGYDNPVLAGKISSRASVTTLHGLPLAG